MKNASPSLLNVCHSCDGKGYEKKRDEGKRGEGRRAKEQRREGDEIFSSSQ